MKSKSSSSPKKQPVVVKDLKSKKNPKGGATISGITIVGANVAHKGRARF